MTRPLMSTHGWRCCAIEISKKAKSYGAAVEHISAAVQLSRRLIVPNHPHWPNWVNCKVCLRIRRCQSNLISMHFFFLSSICPLGGTRAYVRLGEYDTSMDLDCIYRPDGTDCADPPVDFQVTREFGSAMNAPDIHVQFYLLLVYDWMFGQVSLCIRIGWETHSQRKMTLRCWF